MLCVRWYLRYAWSYRDLEEMMLKRGLSVDHTTIFRQQNCFYISPFAYHFKNVSIFSSGQQLMMSSLPAHPRRAWAMPNGR